MRLRPGIIAGIVVAIAAPAVAYGYLAWNTKDSPAPARLAPAPTGGATADAGAAGGEPGPVETGGIEGSWDVVATHGFVGYRIRERLGPLPAPSDAVGRTQDVTGTVSIDGRWLVRLDLVVDMTTLRSDVDSRDERMRTEALETNTFPEARFALTEPVELPEPRIGDVVSLQVAGDLTLHGRTNPVAIDLQARWDGPLIQVAGSARIRRADFGISVAGLPGFRIDSSGIFEFEVALIPSGSDTEPTASTIADNPATRTGINDDPPCTGDTSPELPGGLTFTAYDPGGLDVWIAEPGAQPRVLVERAAAAAWSPDGTRIVYATAPITDEPPELMLANADGTGVQPLGVVDAYEPDWSPEGALIAFTRPADDWRSEIWVVDADGNNARRLIGDAQLDASQPRWTSDGTALVFTSLSDTTNDDVMIADADGRNVRPLANSDAYEYSGSIHSHQLTFVLDGQVRAAATDGSDPRAVTDGPHDSDPALAPDVATLAFLTRGNVFVGDLVAGDYTCLVVGRNVGGDLRWRPTA